MGVSPLLVLAAVSAVAAVVLTASAFAVPASRRERMLRTLAAFGAGVVDTRPGRRTFTDIARPPVVRFIQLIGDVVSPPFARKRLSRSLDYAGNPPSWPLARVIRARMVGMVVLGPFGWYLSDGLMQNSLLGLPLGALAGLLLPGILVSNAAAKRQKAVERSLPDVLDALVIGVEAGLGLDAALAQVATMLHGPMPGEINRMLQEMRLGVSRGNALRALSARTSVRDLRRLATALVQAGDLGISVGGILREHASDQRLRRRQRAEEQAQKVTIKLLFPVLLCLFPVIFVVVLGPAILSMLENFN